MGPSFFSIVLVNEQTNNNHHFLNARLPVTETSDPYIGVVKEWVGGVRSSSLTP